MNKVNQLVRIVHLENGEEQEEQAIVPIIAEVQPEENIAPVTEVYMIVPQEVTALLEVLLQHYVMQENIQQQQEDQVVKLAHAEHILIKEQM